MAPVRAWAPVPEPRLPAATARAIVVERARRRVVRVRAVKPLAHLIRATRHRVPDGTTVRRQGPSSASLPIAFDRISPMVRSVRPHICAVGVCLVAVLVTASASPAGRASAVRLPAAGELVSSRAAVRAAPDPQARVVRIMSQFRPDSQFQIVLAVKARRGSDGGWWYHAELAGPAERAAGMGSRRSCRPSAGAEPDRRPRSRAHDRGAANRRTESCCSVMSSRWAGRAPRRRSGATSTCRRALLPAIRSSAPSSWRRARIRS